VLICTYEQPRELALALAGFERQSRPDFEMVICDDGSGPATAEVIAEAQRRAPVPLRHVRHEHQGFRRAAILNAGLRGARGRLVIFVDGDCIPDRHFVRDHVEAWSPGTYLTGRRVDLGEGLSQRLTPDQVRAGFFDRALLRLAASALAGGTRHYHRALRIGPPWLRRLARPGPRPGIQGSNFSVAREDMVTINGYDEAFEGYGHEDTELEIRLRCLGLRATPLKHIALQYHLWHPRRFTAPANVERMARALQVDRMRCARGMVRLGEPDVLDSKPPGVTFE
jgi:glycosyltransferase involved in cell wall biosynthesis